MNQNIKSDKLISVVEKKTHSDYGAFFNMIEDLGYYIDNVHDMKNKTTESKLIHMAYAYARRYATAGLYAQGAINQDEYSHMHKVFISLQHSTGTSKEFQIEAHKQALHFVLSYSNKLTPKLITYFVENVENGVIPCIKDRGEWYEFEPIVEMHTKIGLEENTRDNYSSQEMLDDIMREQEDELASKTMEKKFYTKFSNKTLDGTSEDGVHCRVHFSRGILEFNWSSDRGGTLRSLFSHSTLSSMIYFAEVPEMTFGFTLTDIPADKATLKLKMSHESEKLLELELVEIII